MAYSYYKHGDHNAICDRCGFKYKASELRKTWDNLWVCPKDFELRHPQDFLRAREDRQTVLDARPETQDYFIPDDPAGVTDYTGLLLDSETGLPLLDSETGLPLEDS